MPKVTRTRTRLHKEAAPKVNERKFAVKEKEVLERIETAHSEPQVIEKKISVNVTAIYSSS
jgi:hypothetical protein